MMNENKFTPRAEEALRLSQEAAEELGHGYVGSEHLLLGLLREEEGLAHRVLTEYGLTDEMILSVLRRNCAVAGADAPRQGRRGAGRVGGRPHGRADDRHGAPADGHPA